MNLDCHVLGSSTGLVVVDKLDRALIVVEDGCWCLLLDFNFIQQ
jgi:hypothetical protein